MTYELMYSVERSLEQGSLQRAVLLSRRHLVMFEVTCGCPTGGGGGLLAKNNGELPTEHRTIGKHRPHTDYQGWDARHRADLTGGTQGLPSV